MLMLCIMFYTKQFFIGSFLQICIVMCYSEMLNLLDLSILFNTIHIAFIVFA